MSTFDDINQNGRPTKILVDMSAMMYQMAFSLEQELVKSAYTDWSIFKYWTIQNLTAFRNKFNDAEMIICCDAKKLVNNRMMYWRHTILPEYKESRKKSTSTIPKEIIIKQFELMLENIHEYTNWKVVKVAGYEADDVIAVMCDTFASDNLVIYGTDHDLQQLMVNPNVYFWNIRQKAFEKIEDPKKILFRNCVKGDSGDGVPNIFSDADTLVNPDKRQKPIRETLINEMYSVYLKDVEEFKTKYLTTDEIKTRFINNQKLISLVNLPEHVKKNIIKAYNECHPLGTKKKFWSWAIQEKLSDLNEIANQVFG